MHETSSSALVSVVVPVFNEARNVGPLLLALRDVAATRPDVRWEFIFVDDGSRDDSMPALAALAAQQSDVRVVALARNFGKELALSAGVFYAHGDAVITMDADLQHPPALIPAMLDLWQQGVEVVVGVRRSTERKSVPRRLGSLAFSLFERAMAGESVVHDGTDFRLIDRMVRDAFVTVRERRRAYRQIVDWLGYRRAEVSFDAGPRSEGASTYSLPKLWSLAIDMVVSRSSVPLRLLLYVGLLICFASALSLAWMFLAYYYVDTKWYYTPLAQALVFNTLLIGVILTALGVVGLYVARIHEEILGRPLYLVRRTINVERAASAPSSSTGQAA